MFRVHNVENTFNATNDEVHDRKRRILSQAFSERRLRGVEDRILVHINRFCDYLGGDVGAAKDEKTDKGYSRVHGHNMATKAWHLIFDITADLCFGRNFDLIGKEKERFMQRYISDSLQRDHTVRGPPSPFLCILIICQFQATGFFKLHSWCKS